MERKLPLQKLKISSRMPVHREPAYSQAVIKTDGPGVFLNKKSRIIRLIDDSAGFFYITVLFFYFPGCRSSPSVFQKAFLPSIIFLCGPAYSTGGGGFSVPPGLKLGESHRPSSEEKPSISSRPRCPSPSDRGV